MIIRILKIFKFSGIRRAREKGVNPLRSAVRTADHSPGMSQSGAIGKLYNGIMA